MSTLSETIALHYAHLTKSARKIADYLSAHPEEAQYLSISALAKECGVAEATIFRFCRALGFSGYNELKIALAQSNAMAGRPYHEAYGSVEPGDDLETLCARVYSANMNALVKTRTVLPSAVAGEAVDLLQKARRVYCFGYGGSMMVAMDVWTRFMVFSDKFFAIQDAHLQLTVAGLLTPEDVLLTFSYSSAPRELTELLHVARSRGAKTILVTSCTDSVPAHLADCVLPVSGPEGPLQSGCSIPAKIAMLYAADVLVNEYIRRDTDTANRNRGAVKSAVASRLV